MDDNDLIDSILQESNTETQEPSNDKLLFDDLLKQFSDNRQPDSSSSPSIITPSTKITGYIPETKSQPTLQQEKLVIPTFSTPLEYINFFETYLSANSKINSIFSSSTSNDQWKKKIIPLEFTSFIELGQKIFSRNDVTLTAMTSKGDLIAIGDSKGEIGVYSIKEQKELKHLTCESKASVTSADITEENDFIIAGYSNGEIVLFDIHAGKEKYTIKTMHTSSVLNLKIYKREKKNFWFFSSDCDGHVYSGMIKDWVIKYGLNEVREIYTSENKEPTFLIKIIDFPKEIKEKTQFITNLTKGVIFASSSEIRIYSIEKIEMKNLFIFTKPNYIKDDNILPDASFGLGKPPTIKNLKTRDIKQQILLLFSWGKILYISVLPVLSGKLDDPYEIGYYISPLPILRTGFLKDSLIYIFDSSKVVKVLNSRQFNIGPIKNFSTGEPEVPLKNNSAELDEGRLIDQDVKCQYFIDENNQKREFYLSFILENNDNLLLLGKRNLYNGKLLHWETCLNNLMKNGDWDDLLKIGIEIFYARMPALAGIPLEENKRRDSVGKFLKQAISQYVLFNIGNKSLSMQMGEKEDDEEKVNKCIETAIDFCIEIEAPDYLFTSVQQAFDSKDYTERFLSKMEPFILSDKLSLLPISKDVVKNIIDTYKKIKKMDELSNLLVHLNIKSVDIDIVRKECDDVMLINTYIYLCMFGKNEDYFAPITKMFIFYLSSISLKPFIGYKEEYEMNHDITKIKKSQQYLGHKLLWYIKWCLSGKKYPDNKTNMKKDLFKQIIQKITYWMLSPKVLEEYSRLDIKSYFTILSMIFSNQKLYNFILEGGESNNRDKSYTIFSDLEIKDLHPKTLIDAFIKQCNLISNDTNDSIELNLNLFIAKASHLISFSKEQSMRTAKFIIQNYASIIGKNNFNDDEIYSISDDLIELFKEENKFDDSNKRDIFIKLQENNNNPFDETKVYFCKLLKEHRKCLETYLNPTSRLKNKTKNLFTWINKILNDIQDNNQLNTFKTDIINKVLQIASLSLNDFKLLVDTWFQNEKRTILTKLEDDPKIELSFIDLIIKDINQRLKEGFDEDIDSEINGFSSSLLKNHIKLLCQLNRKDEVLPNLHKNPSYPINECLNLCIQYKVNDAAIYLYQQMGDSQNALKLSLQGLQDAFMELCRVLSLKELNDDILYTKAKDQYKKNLKTNIEVCEKNQENNEKIWFDLLDKLVSFSKSLNSKHLNEYKEIEGMINQDKNDLIDKMCSYVGVRTIINIVTNKKEKTEFKDFKQLLIKVLSTYSNITKIYISAKELLSNSVNLNENEFIRFRTKGNYYNIGRCRECNGEFERKKMIAVFPCSHIAHEECTDNEDEELVCRTCRRNEIQGVNEVGSKFLLRKTSSHNMDEERYLNLMQNNVWDASAKNAKLKMMELDQRTIERKIIFNEKNGVNVKIIN